MGYRNQAVIKDLYGVEESAKQNALLNQTIVQSAQMFANVQKEQRVKAEKLEASFTTTFNQLTTASNKRQDVYAQNMVSKGASLEMVEAYRKNARTVFNGDGTWNDGDDITDTNVGVIRAQAMINTKRFKTPAEREKLQEIVNSGPTVLDWSLKVAGDFGSEIEEIDAWLENGADTKNMSLMGFSDGDQMTTLYTATAMTNRKIPGVTSSMVLDPDTKGQVWTHTIAVDDVKVKDLDLIESNLEAITVKKEGGKYIMTQRFDANSKGNILRTIPLASDWLAEGKDVVIVDNKIIQDYVLDLGTTVKSVGNGFVQPTSISYVSDTGLTADMMVKINQAAGRVVGGPGGEGGMDRQGQFSFMRSRHGVDIKEAYPKWFTDMTYEKKLGIVKGFERDSMMATYANGYTRQKLDKTQIQTILNKKAEGDATLQAIPEQNIVDPNDANKTIENPLFTEWKNGEHYVKITKEATRNSVRDGIDKDLSTWNKKSKQWFSDPNFGKNNTRYYTPGKPAVGVKGDADYIPAVSPVNEGFANIIYGRPDREGVGSRSIIQTGEDTWQAMNIINYGNNNFGYKPIGESVKKTDVSLKQWLGIN